MLFSFKLRALKRWSIKPDNVNVKMKKCFSTEIRRARQEKDEKFWMPFLLLHNIKQTHNWSWQFRYFLLLRFFLYLSIDFWASRNSIFDICLTKTECLTAKPERRRLFWWVITLLDSREINRLDFRTNVKNIKIRGQLNCFNAQPTIEQQFDLNLHSNPPTR